MSVKAQKVRTVIVQQANIADLWTALSLLSNGSGLTALQSGVMLEPPIKDLTMVGEIEIVFDGFYWNAFLFVTTA